MFHFQKFSLIVLTVFFAQLLSSPARADDEECKKGFICEDAPVSNPSTSAPAVAPTAAPIGLATTTGFEIGGQVSSYGYQENTVAGQDFMHESGAKFGITATASKAFASGFFVTADTRFAYSSNHYSSPGSGERGGIPDYLGEVRLLGGKDFVAGKIGLSPFIGIGYRNLYNDLSGSKLVTERFGSNTITQRVYGYGRDSQYLYLPVGLTPRVRLTDHSRLSATIEYDQLLQGWQESYFSDISSSYPNIPNRQNGGYGLRGSLMYEEKSWSLGPFLNYWNIDESDADRGFSAIRPGYYSFEPHNHTFEYGLQARYRF